MNRLVLLVLGLFITSNSCKNYTTDIPAPDATPIEIPLNDPYEGFKVITEDQDEYSCVGQVFDKNGMVGSAVAIGGNVVITAGHCIDGNELSEFHTNNRSYKIIKQQTHPLFKIKENILMDVGILFLEEPVCLQTYPTLPESCKEQLTRFEPLTTVGFSHEVKKKSNPDSFYYYGILSDNPLYIVFNSTKGCHVWFGDSGGAVFEEKGKLIALIASFTIIDSTVIEMSGIRLDLCKPWIEQMEEENKDIWVK